MTLKCNVSMKIKILCCLCDELLNKLVSFVMLNKIPLDGQVGSDKVTVSYDGQVGREVQRLFEGQRKS